MTQNQKTTNPKGVCEKLCNIVNPFKSSTQTTHHTNIPIGFDPLVTDFSSSIKPKKTSRKKHTFERKEIVVFNGQENDQKGVSRNGGLAHRVFKKAAPGEAKEQSVHFSVEKINSKKNDDSKHETEDHDGKFSDYISEVKKKIMRTVTRINGADHGPGRVTKRRDSFNDRITNYIDQAKIKMIRTTTNIGDEKGFSSK